LQENVEAFKRVIEAAQPPRHRSVAWEVRPRRGGALRTRVVATAASAPAGGRAASRPSPRSPTSSTSRAAKW